MNDLGLFLNIEKLKDEFLSGWCNVLRGFERAQKRAHQASQGHGARPDVVGLSARIGIGFGFAKGIGGRCCLSDHGRVIR